MSVVIRRARPDDLPAIGAFDARNFGDALEQDEIGPFTAALDPDRFLIGHDGDAVVAAGGSYEMDLTLPGGATIPISGVTWVSVAATHRRQGLLRRLMAGLDELSEEFGEPALALTASEGGIYERFGYGVATSVRVTEIERSRARIDPRWSPEPVELIEVGDRLPELFDLWDRHRRGRIGEVSRSDALFEALFLDRKKPTFAALHRDGYVIYGIEARWNDGHPAHRLTVRDLAAATPEAHLALWNLLLSVDLVGPIRSIRAMALDDPLPQLLTDPRAVRTVELNDGLWLKITDPVRCFGDRTYRVADELAIGVVETVDDLVGGESPSETVAVGPGVCRHVDGDRAPDLMVCRSALGPLLLGQSASALARGRRLEAEPDILDRADALFGTGVAAHCASPF